MRTLLILLAVALHCASASAQALRVLSAGAFKQEVVSFVPAFEDAHGVKVEVLNDTAGALLKRIATGETFEILPVSGVVLAELLPDEIQNATTYGHAIAADTRPADLARQFVAVLATRDAADVIRAKGMQPLP